jgi:hypothetical protein
MTDTYIDRQTEQMKAGAFGKLKRINALCPEGGKRRRQRAYVSIRQHSIRQHTSAASASKRRALTAQLLRCQHVYTSGCELVGGATRNGGEMRDAEPLKCGWLT